MTFSDFVVYTCLVIFVLYITRINNLWGVNRSTNKAKGDVKYEKKLQRKRRILLWLLSKCEWASYSIGVTPKGDKLLDLKYKIGRLNLQIKLLNREIKPEELVGFFRLFMSVTTMIAIIGFFGTGVPIFLGFLVFLGTPWLFEAYASFKIADQDKQLEEEFPDLYLLLYTRLVQGTRARISPVLRDYLTSYEVTYGSEHKSPIKSFVLDFMKNIDLYGDDAIAITRLRDKYRSVMVINFCNLAIQAIRGVNNRDKLLSFKIELTQKRMEQMKVRAARLVSRGRKAVLLVYLILFQFILISWISKFTGTTGIFDIWRSF